MIGIRHHKTQSHSILCRHRSTAMPVRAYTEKTMISTSFHATDRQLDHAMEPPRPVHYRVYQLITLFRLPQRPLHPARKPQGRPLPDFVQPEFSCDATPHH
jgi:hypothetical protein